MPGIKGGLTRFQIALPGGGGTALILARQPLQGCGRENANRRVVVGQKANQVANQGRVGQIGREAGSGLTRNGVIARARRLDISHERQRGTAAQPADFVFVEVAHLRLADLRQNIVQPFSQFRIVGPFQNQQIVDPGRSGSDGIQLEFRPLVDQELPPFVYDRWRQANGAFIHAITKGNVVALQRMETPVTYFYTARPRDVRVRVDFPHGLLTEFYPPANEMSPAYSLAENKLTDSSLTWQARLHPPAEFARIGGKADGPPELPAVGEGDHYGEARDTDSAVVEVSDSSSLKHSEKFLFYRGVGSFSLPLRLESLPDRRFRLANDGPDPVESLFMVTIDTDGLRFCQQSEVPAAGMVEMTVPEQLSTGDELGDRMAEVLVATGLYDKEARAMVRTWRSSWFTEPGARLFYIVPRRLTDEIIPLKVDPAPDEVVRVLVGRMEVLTPEAGDRLRSAIDSLGTCLSIDADPLRSELEALGRFAEPALASLLDQMTDGTMREAIGRVQVHLRRETMAD